MKTHIEEALKEWHWNEYMLDDVAKEICKKLDKAQCTHGHHISNQIWNRWELRWFYRMVTMELQIVCDKL